MAEGCPELSQALVQAYVETLREHGRTASTINQRLAAIRKLAREAAENGWLDEHRARGIEGVKGDHQEGERTGNGLSKGRRRPCSMRQIYGRSKGCATGRFWRCSLAVACAGRSWCASRSRMSSSVTGPGQSSICAASATRSAVCRWRAG